MPSIQAHVMNLVFRCMPKPIICLVILWRRVGYG